uniref:OTU domain-containing protein n=1 Tax=Arion vulgaris TaxID=1028688 RepID=A0A0B7A1K5_9EUPU
MPGRSYTGGGSIYRQSGKMTRNIRPVSENGDDHLPQKREERAMREAYRKEKRMTSYLADDENFPSFRVQLAKMGLQLRDIPADGNCLFRALGDQLEGHGRNHFRHRAEVVNYMRTHRHDFEPFVEDDMPFDEHVRTLQKLGTHAGNDAIVAFAKLHEVNVVIHQLNGKPLMIQGPVVSNENSRQLHLGYHNGDHYSSIRKVNDNTESPAHIRLQDSESQLTQYKKNGHDSASGVVSMKRSLEDIETEVALATNCMDMERVRQVLCECDYDVDASIADLLQQLELANEATQDDNTSCISLQTSTTDSGVWNLSTSTNSGGDSSPNSCCAHDAAYVLRNVNHNLGGGKCHKVYYREESVGGSSGYGSLSSYSGGGARPKVIPAPQISHRKVKETKKFEKKRRAEERRREKILGTGQNIPQANDVRDVTVVALNNSQLTRI